MLHMVSGWLLSIDFTHVRRNAYDGHLFLPFLHTQKCVNRKHLNHRAPDNLRGSESEVARCSEVYQGKSLLFVTAEGFRLIKSWEAGYRYAFPKPYLPGTFLRNLPQEVKTVIRGA